MNGMVRSQLWKPWRLLEVAQVPVSLFLRVGGTGRLVTGKTQFYVGWPSLVTTATGVGGCAPSQNLFFSAVVGFFIITGARVRS